VGFHFLQKRSVLESNSCTFSSLKSAITTDPDTNGRLGSHVAKLVSDVLRGWRGLNTTDVTFDSILLRKGDVYGFSSVASNTVFRSRAKPVSVPTDEKKKPSIGGSNN
jgi:hypothetical protein